MSGLDDSGFAARVVFLLEEGGVVLVPVAIVSHRSGVLGVCCMSALSHARFRL